MVWLEKATKNLMLLVGCIGVLVIYFGFFYLLLNGRDTTVLPWYLLLSPWVCIFYGLPSVKKVEVIEWFRKKFVKK